MECKVCKVVLFYFYKRSLSSLADGLVDTGCARPLFFLSISDAYVHTHTNTSVSVRMIPNTLVLATGLEQ